MEDVFVRIKKGKYRDIPYITPECRDLLSQMMNINVKKRITANQIMSHPWIVKHKGGCCETTVPHDHEKITRDVISKLINYRGKSLLKKTAINVLVK